MVKARVQAYKDAGITTLRLAPAGKTLAERLDCLGRTMDIVRSI
ncbi:MAG: hypothetical protein U5O39_08145 [Gammaproteobacteria bacterium]|nr:hypothetical protein [Gammaproteobacteria bacterium]